MSPGGCDTLKCANHYAVQVTLTGGGINYNARTSPIQIGCFQ
jgi:hypothetical protein